MAQRQLLNELLKTVVDNVYFQPPDNTRMVYPCIVYSLSDIDNQHADNVPYSQTWKYQITIIDRDPDSIIVDKVSAFPMCSFSSYFVTENLNHTVFSLYF